MWGTTWAAVRVYTISLAVEHQGRKTEHARAYTRKRRCISVSYLGYPVSGLGHFHTDCTLWGRLVFGKIQERLWLELGLGLENTRARNFHLLCFEFCDLLGVLKIHVKMS